MLSLILALTVLLADLFPVFRIVYSLPGISGIEGELSSMLLALLVDYGPALAVSQWCLRKLDVAPFVDQLPRGRKWIHRGIVLFAVYVALAVAGPFLTRAFYGIGLVGHVSDLLSMVAKGFVFAGLAVALCKELPMAQRASRAN